MAELTHPAVGGGQRRLSRHGVHAARAWFTNTASDPNAWTGAGFWRPRRMTRRWRSSGVTAGQAVRGPTPASWRASKSNGRAASCPAAPADQGKGNENIGIVSPEMSLARVTPYRLTDAFCGFKAYRVAALERLHLTERGYALPLEFWVQAARGGLRVREVPVKLLYVDLSRNFRGGLEDPLFRLRHYLDVMDRELAAWDAEKHSAGGLARRAPAGTGPARTERAAP